MTKTLSRRALLEGVAALPVASVAAHASASSPPTRPVVIASANGWRSDRGRASAVEATMSRLAASPPEAGDFALLEAIVDGVGVVEDDPKDHTVGLGGLPNEEGVVQLDASLMFGPTHQCGAVGAIENIQNPARVAMKVLRYTDHSFLVGEGAYRFARAHGLPHRELLTEEARKIWLYWKQTASDRDDWVPPRDDEVEPWIRDRFTTGTIHLSAVSAQGDLASVTTTSGLSFKIPGRVGDSPIVGAGMYCDNDVGSAGATGRGEEAIASCGAHSVVDEMSRGREPEEACLEVLKKVAVRAKKRGLMKGGKPTFELNLYALRKDGVHGGARMYEGGRYAVIEGGDARGRHAESAFLYEK